MRLDVTNYGVRTKYSPTDYPCAKGWIHIYRPGDASNGWMPVGCKRPNCSDCWRQRCLRNRDTMERFIGADPGFTSSTARFLTWSIRNSQTLREAWTGLADTERRFRNLSIQRNKRGLPHSWQTVDNFIGVWEVTHHENSGYNVHAHLLLSSSQRPDYAGWVKDWRTAANDPYVGLRFERITPKTGISYLVGYSLGKRGKVWGGLNPGDGHDWSFLRGKRSLRRKRGQLILPRRSEWAYCCGVENPMDCVYA